MTALCEIDQLRTVIEFSSSISHRYMTLRCNICRMEMSGNKCKMKKVECKENVFRSEKKGNDATEENKM